MNNIIINPHYCSREEYQELKDYLTEKCWDWQEVSDGKEEKTRTVIYCPICGWETFDEDQYENECGQTNCPGKLTETRTETYEE